MKIKWEVARRSGYDQYDIFVFCYDTENRRQWYLTQGDNWIEYSEYAVVEPYFSISGQVVHLFRTQSPLPTQTVEEFIRNVVTNKYEEVNSIAGA